MAELKKCPFCGGEAELNYYGSESMPFYSISCKECGCNQDTSIHKEAVINAWNNRATEAEIRAKALSDFIEAVRQKFPNDEIAIWKLEQLAEQLKEE